MNEEMLERLISQKEKEIRDLQKFAKWLGNEHIEKQIDLRLEDLKNKALPPTRGEPKKKRKWKYTKIC